MRQYSAKEKYQALGAFRLGNAIKEIAEALNLPIRTVYRWCRRFEAQGNCDRAQGSGRPRRTSRRADRRLLRIVERARFSTSQQLLAARKSVSSSTVQRRLYEHGFVARRHAIAPLLTPRHRTVRLSWGMTRCHFRSQLDRIIFSDESRIKLRPIDGGCGGAPPSDSTRIATSLLWSTGAVRSTSGAAFAREDGPSW